MGVIEKFTTSEVRSVERLSYWNRLTGETYPGTVIDQRDERFEAEMLRWTLGDMIMIRPQSKAAIVTRTPTSANEERLVLHLQHRGQCRQEQRNRPAEMGGGDFTLHTNRSPYRLEAAEHEFLVVEFARAALDARVQNLDDVIAMRISGGAPGTRMLHGFFLSLWQQGDLSAADPDWQAGVADVLLDLIALAIRGAEMPLSEPLALRERALRFVEAHLDEPKLGSDMIATDLRVSIRTVQNLFAQMGTTPGGHILARRLARASEMLMLDPHRSITEVAFDLGFSESSYFSRCFRQQFGTTPSRWRVQH